MLGIVHALRPISATRKLSGNSIFFFFWSQLCFHLVSLWWRSVCEWWTHSAAGWILFLPRCVQVLSRSPCECDHILFGNRVFVDVIRLSLSPKWLVSFWEEAFGTYMKTSGGDHVITGKDWSDVSAGQGCQRWLAASEAGRMAWGRSPRALPGTTALLTAWSQASSTQAPRAHFYSFKPSVCEEFVGSSPKTHMQG